MDEFANSKEGIDDMKEIRTRGEMNGGEEITLGETGKRRGEEITLETERKKTRGNN